MEELFKVTVIVDGIKKKCRKSDRHFLRLGYKPYNNGEFNREEIEETAKASIQTNIRQVTGRIIVVLDHIKRGDMMEQWQPFSDKNIQFELKSSLENVLQ
jgi:hypothetical protein